MTDDDHPILFIPGPVEVDPELREIMAMPLLGHRSQPVKDAVVRVCEKLRPTFRTTQHAFFENVPGTGVMEAAVRNLIPHRSLHLVAGAFGERWVKIVKACGREPTVVNLDWGTAPTAALVAEHLDRADVSFDAVCITHSETSTGALAELEGIARTVREKSPNTLVLVDAVTSFAGAPLEFDAWDIDLAFAGTQKCLALPPGLACFAVSERAMSRAGDVPDRGFLLDFVACPDRFAKGAPPATPCVPLIFALDRQLDRIAAEGLENRWLRHRTMRDRTLAWGEAQGFAPFVAEPEHRSPTVTTLCAEGERLDAVIAAAKAAGFTLGKGYGDLKERTFRVGHMGDHSLARLDALLDAITPRVGA